MNKVNQFINLYLFILSNNIVNRNNFEFCYIIGKGGFGKVWKVRHKQTKKYYALKEMSKMKIIIRKSENSVNFEREILSKLHNKFIVNMYYAFQDKDNLYLVMDYLKGGDLRFHLTRHNKFSEEQSRFFICNIITALEYIHSNNIIHRDIKPENLVLEEEGYVRITDFGIAKKKIDDSKGDTSGTPGYMAPEVMKGAAHSFEVDFFAMGIIGYEFMKGKRPYAGKNRKEIREEMLMKQVCIKNEDIEDGWTKESVDFINKLLIRKKENRLGYNGISEVKEHPWIKYYPWGMIIDKTLPSPFIPQNKDNFDLRYCAKTEKIGEETKMRYEELIMDNKFKNIFDDFLFNYDHEQKMLKKNKEKNNNSNLNKNIINTVYNRVNKYNYDLNSMNGIYNNKASYKQLPNINNKIIIDIAKDKYNTINDINNNKKVDIKPEETLYGSLFKKENMKINKIFEQKINNKKMKSNSNILANNNISLNNKIYRRRINISGIISPARSDKILLKNKEECSSKITLKNNKKKSCVFSNINCFSNKKSPSFQNINTKNIIYSFFNKYSTLLSKSNSYRIKNNSKPKNKSVKKNIYNKNKNSHKSHRIAGKSKSKLIPIQLNNKNNNQKKQNNEVSHNKNLIDENINSILLINEKYLNKSKSRMYGNDNLIIKNKINTTSNYISNNNSKNISNINKTFLKENNMQINENILISENNNSKKKILINNNRLNINDSIRNIIRYNSKYLSLKEIILNNPHIIKSKFNEIKNNYDKENISENIVNNNKNLQFNKKYEDGKKDRILVNKRAKNKSIILDMEKTKYIFNINSINSGKNPFKNKILKSKTNFSTLNNSSYKNNNNLKGKEKDNYLSYRNIVLSYKQKQNYTGK